MEVLPLSFLVAMALLVISLPRHLAIAPLLMTSVLMTMGPEFSIGPAKFTVMRTVIVVALLRVAVRGEAKGFVAGPIDRAIFWWTLVAVVMWLLPIERHSKAVMPVRTFVEQLMMSGRFMIEFAGLHVIGRCFIRREADVQFAVKVLIVLAVILGGFMSVEKITGRNLFSILGGVPEFTSVRDGKFRCMGSFSHPIQAGVFGATVVPLCMGMWLYGRRTLAAVGIAASTQVVIASASSGPLMSWVAGCVAFALWTIKGRMQMVRRLIALTLLVAELGMKGHCWWLIAKVSDVVGGGGYWRANLIDQCVSHFSEWWLRGTGYTAHWSPTGSGQPEYPDHMDLTNQFVAEAVNGGGARLILFVAVIVACYRKAGEVARDPRASFRTQAIFWSLGSMLSAYLMAFFSVAGSAQNAAIFMWMTAALALVPSYFSPHLELPDMSGAKLSPAGGQFQNGPNGMAV